LDIQIDDLIQDRDEIILEMQRGMRQVLQVINKWSQSCSQGRRSSCRVPFRQSTLAKLDEDIKGIRGNLLLAFEVLNFRNSSRTENETEEIKSLLDLVRTSQISSVTLISKIIPASYTPHNQLV